MATFSFDVVSEYNKAEINNVFAAVQRDIGNRYDFRGTSAAVEWLGDKDGFTVTGSGDWQIDSIVDIIRKHVIARSQDPKILDLSKDIRESSLKAVKDVPLLQGLDQDKAKQITKKLRDEFPKVKAQIQGEAVRVSSTSKDELQQVMRALRTAEFDFALSFTNFR